MGKSSTLFQLLRTQTLTTVRKVVTRELVLVLSKELNISITHNQQIKFVQTGTLLLYANSHINYLASTVN